MKVIMLKDVKGVGRAHETVETKDGHALNHLIPKKLAIAATSGAVKGAEVRRTKVVEKDAATNAVLAENVAKLAAVQIVIKAKVNEKGHLYDAVNEADVRKAVAEQAKVEFPEGSITLDKPLKEAGTFDIAISAGETSGTFSLTIEGEE